MPEKSQEKTLILASASPYRREQLERLRLAFDTASPDIDETPLPDESVQALVARLAGAKARKVAQEHPGSVVIGCDQLAHFQGRAVGKPGNAARAAEQLTAFSGGVVEFLSALCVVDSGLSREYRVVIPTMVKFRELSTPEIERYIALDKPLDCAGSFKSECAGPGLLKSMSSDDPSAIIGLPLIALGEMLRKCGFRVP